MNGHGCPYDRDRSTPARRLFAWRLIYALFVISQICFSPSALLSCVQQNLESFGVPDVNNRPPIRLRVSWGGGQNQIWQGAVLVDNAEISDVTPIGLNGDSSVTALQVNGRQIAIDQGSASSYDGFDFTISGTDGTRVGIQLSAHDSPETQWKRSFDLEQLLGDGIVATLDDAGHNISITRVPGDAVNVRFDRDNLILFPNARLRISVTGNRMPLRSSRGSCKLSIVPARKLEPVIWKTSADLAIDKSGNFSATNFDVPVPSDEGVYDLVIQIEKNWLSGSIKASNPAVRPLAGKTGVIQRRIQFVVIDPKASAPLSAKSARVVQTLTPEDLLEVPVRWNLSRTVRKVLSTQPPTVIQDRGQSWWQLDPGQWHALPIKTDRVGQPHVVEIEFDNSGPLAVGLTVLDFDSNGQVPIQGADSGILIPQSVTHQVVQETSTTNSHPKLPPGKQRLRFWPRSKLCYLLVANQSNRNVARLGKVDVLAPDSQTFPQNSAPRPARTTRQRLAFCESANYAQALNVEQFFDNQVNQPLDDWVVFYQGALRLIDYLKSNQYQGAVVPVLIDGGTLYPSALFAATPNCDSGTFQSLGQDPKRKDVLRLLLKMFERENLTLIPAFEFSGPVSPIELNRRAGENDFDLVDVSGNPVFKTNHLPFYNPLSPTVQQHVAAVIVDVVQRYGKSRALGGAALMCHADSWTLLPGRQYGYDRTTIERFLNAQSTTQIGMNRFDENRKLINQQTIQTILSTQRESWIQWRCDQMSNFYLQLASIIEQEIPSGRLLIAPIDIQKNQELASLLSPNLHASVDVTALLKRMGLDRERLQQSASITLLNPQTLPPTTSVAASRVVEQTKTLTDFHSFFRQRHGQSGTLLQHRGTWAHFAQLQSLAPFNKQNGRLMRQLQLPPEGLWRRQPMATALAVQDAALMVDSSTAMSMGQSRSIENFAAVFSKLPQQKFNDVPFSQNWTNQRTKPPSSGNCPIAVRVLNESGKTYLYCVNDSPWPTQVNVHLTGINSLESPKGPFKLASTRNQPSPSITALSNPAWGTQSATENGQVISVNLPAYEIWAGSFSTDVSVSHFDIQIGAANSLDQSSALIHKALRKKIYQLQAKLSLATSAAPINVLNSPSFETDNSKLGEGWDYEEGWGERIGVETNAGYKSQSSLRIKSAGESHWVRTNSFAPPETGRLSITVWIKSTQVQQPPLRLAIEGQTRHSTYYRFGAIGALAPDSEVNQIDQQWRRFAVHFDDLPTDELIDLRVGFDLMGAGEVLIDNVKVYDRWFDEKDAAAMTQLFASALELSSQAESFESCRKIVEGHWARFLDQYIDQQENNNVGVGQKNTDGQIEMLFDEKRIDRSQFGNLPTDLPADYPDDRDAPKFDHVGEKRKSGTSLLRRWRNSLKRRQ